MTSAPYRVLDESHWAMAGTGFATEISSERRRSTNVSLAEPPATTDEVSANFKDGSKIRKRDQPYDGADLVCHETGRGAVFGSIHHLVSALFTDAHVSRITCNVLERFLKKWVDE
jgi:hypothetical protein